MAWKWQTVLGSASQGDGLLPHVCMTDIQNVGVGRRGRPWWNHKTSQDPVAHQIFTFFLFFTKVKNGQNRWFIHHITSLSHLNGGYWSLFVKRLLREEMVTLEEGLKITDFTTNYPSELASDWSAISCDRQLESRDRLYHVIISYLTKLAVIWPIREELTRIDFSR